MALGSATAPVVFTLKDCDTAVWCKVITKASAITKRKSLVMLV
jgi:alpha-D-ribose 1-methylphosphonate 5-triphosphate synthase subunit PhnH